MEGRHWKRPFEEAFEADKRGDQAEGTSGALVLWQGQPGDTECPFEGTERWPWHVVQFVKAAGKTAKLRIWQAANERQRQHIFLSSNRALRTWLYGNLPDMSEQQRNERKQLCSLQQSELPDWMCTGAV